MDTNYILPSVLMHWSHVNTDPLQSSRYRYKDKNGLPLVVGGKYLGYSKGVYILRLTGIHVSIVRKILSGKGVAIHKPKDTTLHNDWLRRY